MAEVCKDIDQGLAALNRKIDEQNRRLRELERKQKECCDNNNNKNNNNNNDSLEKRVQKLEKVSEALKEGIIGSLNNFADIENTNQDFALAFQGLYEMVTPVMDVLSTVIEFLGVEDA